MAQDKREKKQTKVPSEHEHQGRAEEETMKDKTHGKDETGAPAPDQVDQAVINKEKIEEKKAGKQVGDPRWPIQEQGGMKVVPPRDQSESAKKLNEDFNKAQEKAMKSPGPANPVTSDKNEKE